MGQASFERVASAPVSAAGHELQVPEAFANLIAYHLRIAQEASFQAIRHGAGKADLKPGWYTILTILSENPGITPTELSRNCGRDRSTLTSTLRDLAARGLVVRRRTQKDQRSYTIRLTAKGEQMLEQVRTFCRLHDAKIDRIVGSKNKAQFIATLRKIALVLSRDRAAGEPADGGSRGARQQKPALKRAYNNKDRHAMDDQRLRRKTP